MREDTTSLVHRRIPRHHAGSPRRSRQRSQAGPVVYTPDNPGMQAELRATPATAASHRVASTLPRKENSHHRSREKDLSFP